MVKPGYKQTEIGTIPEDWTVANFGSKVKIFRGGSPRPIQDYLTQADDGVNWIKIGDVREGDKYITSTEEKIVPEGVCRSRTVHAGDFILSNSMSFGRPYILNIDGCIHDGWLTIQEYEQTFSKDFLYYLLSSDSVYQQYISMAAGSSVKNLNKEKVSALVVAYPEIGEQEKIAEALSCIDTLIAYSEKELAKKRAIKQGAMQELLTGKKRLPGFSGRWYFETMSHYLEMQVGFPFSSQYFNNKGDGLRLIKNRDLKSDDQVYYTTEKCSAEYIVKNGDILIGMDGDFLPCKWNKGSSLLNQRVGRLIQKGPIYLQFAYYALEKPLLELQQGTGATTVKHLSHKDIANLSVWMPPSVDEQRAIAEILSGMDSEIEALEQKLTKYRQVKQGMMQQLLTGKIRLV